MHAEYTALMSLVLDREATAEEFVVLRTHLTDCSTCASIWREWQALDVRLAATPAVTPPPAFMLGLAARLAEREARRRRQRWLASGLLLAWGGTLGVLCLLALSAGIWGYTHPLEVGLFLASGNQVLAGLRETLGGLAGALWGIGEPALATGLAGLVCLTMALAALWWWAVAHNLGADHGVRDVATATEG